MIPLAEPLDTIDFDRLVETALGRLPNLAKEWTDYNYSDPGITLVELLAWVADSQIYSIGRNRLDERMAMARLLGDKPRNAIPARGTLYPSDAIALHFQIEKGTRVTGVGAVVPSVQAAETIAVWPVVIDALIARTADDARDVTDINAQPGASFAAFGQPPAANAQLELVIDGQFPAGEQQLSLGFELAVEGESTAPELSAIDIVYVDGDDAAPVRIVHDYSEGLQRSGAMLLAFTPAAGTRHVFRIANRSSALLPKIRRILPNAVPVIQQLQINVDNLTATGLPNQTFEIDPAAYFSSDEPSADGAWRLSGDDPVRVRVAKGSGWIKFTCLAPEASIDAAEPDERCFTAIDNGEGGAIEIGFGNGVNGERPSEFENIAITMTLSAGARGNVLSSLNWKIAGQGVLWRNMLPVAGGENPDTVATMLQRMKRKLRDQRTLAIPAQIEAAAKSLPRAYGIDRASLIEGWQPGRKRPDSAATRTLVVSRNDAGSETAAWLIAIQAGLRTRLALGERLFVAAPDWRALRIKVAARAMRGLAAADIEKAIVDELAARLNPDGKFGADWPLGRTVTRMAVEGWLRRLPGIEAIDGVELLDAAGTPLPDTGPKFARNSLPKWLPVAGDLAVALGGGRT